MPEVVVRWYGHHSRMLNDNLFSSSFVSWNDMDKQLHTQFINHPFTFEPDSSTDKHLLEFACMDLFLSHVPNINTHSNHTVLFKSYATYQSSCTDYGSSSTTCYDPYTKPLQQGEGKKPTLCLHCRISSQHSEHLFLYSLQPARASYHLWVAKQQAHYQQGQACLCSCIMFVTTAWPSCTKPMEHTCPLWAMPNTWHPTAPGIESMLCL